LTKLFTVTKKGCVADLYGKCRDFGRFMVFNITYPRISQNELDISQVLIKIKNC
jgi:hypothetical protein